MTAAEFIEHVRRRLLAAQLRAAGEFSENDFYDDEELRSHAVHTLRGVAVRVDVALMPSYFKEQWPPDRQGLDSRATLHCDRRLVHFYASAPLGPTTYYLPIPRALRALVEGQIILTA